jgi:hypothetical protein
MLNQVKSAYMMAVVAITPSKPSRICTVEGRSWMCWTLAFESQEWFVKLVTAVAVVLVLVP